MRCVIYLRVSTEEQALSGLGLEAQEAACRVHAVREGWMIADQVYRDEGVSASLPYERRPGLLDAIGALESGSVLLVAKRDRIFRADPFTGAIIERAVTKVGARIVSAAGEGTEDDGPTNILMRRIVDAFGEYERLIIAFRTRSALRAKAARGERIGHTPYGSRLLPDGKRIEADPTELAALQTIRALRAAGCTYRAVADALNAAGTPTKRSGRPWLHGSVYAILKRNPPDGAI